MEEDTRGTPMSPQLIFETISILENEMNSYQQRICERIEMLPREVDEYTDEDLCSLRSHIQDLYMFAGNLRHITDVRNALVEEISKPYD